MALEEARFTFVPSLALKKTEKKKLKLILKKKKQKNRTHKKSKTIGSFYNSVHEFLFGFVSQETTQK